MPVVAEVTKSATVGKADKPGIKLECTVSNCKGYITLSDVTTKVGSTAYSFKAGNSHTYPVPLNSDRDKAAERCQGPHHQGEYQGERERRQDNNGQGNPGRLDDLVDLPAGGLRFGGHRLFLCSRLLCQSLSSDRARDGQGHRPRLRHFAPPARAGRPERQRCSSAGRAPVCPGG